MCDSVCSRVCVDRLCVKLVSVCLHYVCSVCVQAQSCVCLPDSVCSEFVSQSLTVSHGLSIVLSVLVCVQAQLCLPGWLCV